MQFGLMRYGKCCHNNVLPTKVRDAIGTLAAYTKGNTTGKSQEVKDNTPFINSDEVQELIFNLNEPTTSQDSH